MQATHCLRCGASGPVSITLTTKKGQKLAMYSCNTCDARYWKQDGEAVEFENVLALAASWGKSAS